jgi:hypothetical protein
VSLLAAVFASVAVVAGLPTVPGATSRAVTPANVASTICVSGWSSRHRPPYAWSHAVKVRLYATEGRSGGLRAWQLDHLISIELGGAARSLRNVWLQPVGPATRDDRLENRWHRQVCTGTVGLRAAQAFERNWKRRSG